MKRLLAYLFIVLSLGLTFNVNANAKYLELCWKTLSGDEVWVTKNKAWQRGGSGCKNLHKGSDSKLYKEVVKNLNKTNRSDGTNKIYSIKKVNLEGILHNHNKNWDDWLYPENSKIAKAEPSQTQKIIKSDKTLVNLVFCHEDFVSSFSTAAIKTKLRLDNCKKNEYQVNWIDFIDKWKIICYNKSDDPVQKFFQIIGDSCNQFNENIVTIKYDGESFYYGKGKALNYVSNPKIVKPSKTQIAKAEPSQTQKVAKIKKKSLIGVILCQRFSNKQELVKSENWFVLEGNKKCKDNDQTYANPIAVSYNEYIKYNKYRQFCYNKTTKDFAAPKRGTLYASCDVFGKKLGEENQWSEVVWRYTSNNNINYFSPKQTQIAKTETTVKPKKKVKVAKVEPKQEEFKPKKTNQDNEAPVITIAEVITVNDTDYEFQGKVTDQAKTIYVEVDGRPTDVKNGKFIVKGYSPIDKQISIEAIDQWGNRSEPKIVKLTIDIKDTSIAEKLEPLNPSKIRSKVSKDKVALIIGIENYLESPNAKYANLDAKYFFDYARKGFGVKKQNINLLVDEDATFVKTNKALTKWLRSKIKSGQSDLIIFFAGHGLASNDGKELYLLPQDSDPDLLSRTALSRTELFQEIIGLNPKSVTMFLDTCYSGVSRDEKMLLASARPIRIVSNEEQDIPDNFTIFSASQLDQISSGIKEAKHGIFSYYLMKGLEGKADANKDKKITNGELLAYMDENVSQKASELGRQQNPSLAGDPNKVLMSYR